MKFISLPILFFLIGLTTCWGKEISKSYTIVISHQANEAVKISANDVAKYLKQAIEGSTVKIVGDASAKKYDGNIIVIGSRDNNQFIREILKSGKLAQSPKDWNSFEITTLLKKDKVNRVFVLEGADIMGEQYACYDFIERALGVRFLGPEIEFVPKLQTIKSLNNTGIQKPSIKWRGLQIWNYHYDERGTGSFCDINDHYLAKDWQWFKKMCDWLIKNKQNYVQWYDETMCYAPISELVGNEATDYFAMRGIKRLVGLGWAANEGKPKEWVLGKNDFDTSKVCVGVDGKAIGHENIFTVAPCPLSPAYFPLAEKNMDAFNFSKGDILGAVIGYGETERSQRNHNGCVRHVNIPAHDLILKDLEFAGERIKKTSDKKINTGFVIMDFGGNEAPLRTKRMFDALPDSSILFLWTYRDFSWKNNVKLYEWAEQAKAKGKTIQMFQQAEVDFICQSDLPIYRFDVLKRREAHFRSTKDLAITGHSTNYNTNQYMMWLSYWQMMRWQWKVDNASWDENLFALVDDIGEEQSDKIAELFKRVISLEYVKDYSDFASICGTSDDLREINHWKRWANSSDYNNDHGFMLWANISDIKLLEAGEQNLHSAREIMEKLKTNATNQIFNAHIYPVLNYTLNYYALRIHLGKSAFFISKYQETKNAELLEMAINEVESAINEKRNYDANLNTVSATCHDFIFNPDEKLLANYVAFFRKMKSQSGEKGLETYQPFEWKKHKKFFDDRKN